MQYKAIVFILAALISFSCQTYAADMMYPPEKIQCSLLNTGTNAGKLHCEGFDQSYLIEHPYFPQLPPSITLTFTFASAMAIVLPYMKEVIYEYENPTISEGTIDLVTFSNHAIPDTTSPEWQESHGDFDYICRGSNRQCGFSEK